MFYPYWRASGGNKDEDDMRVVVVGSGNVAEALAVSLREAEVDVVQIFSRNESRGRAVASLATTEWSSTELKDADLYLIAVSDSAVEEVSRSLRVAEGAVVAHTAGCVSIDALATHPHRAVFYPFQTFSVGRRVDFTKVYIFLEAASSHAMETVREVAQRLTPHIELADSSRRAVVHLSGVFSSNFVNAMYENATEVLATVGLPFDVIAPIVEECSAKVLEAREPRKTQTGPARRGDMKTLERHRGMLEGDERKRRIYDEISEDIWQKREISKS